ncbi:MAG: hypothetical protein DWQ09_02335 [Proteobacteria bacterium]|nr:MAG: hypothetical protein DWQ09_02335 [Pseudomonadota bacterium]QKK11741.1 MAG: hypothetical protein HND59_09210 [Pseudomonadota bacterium]
MSKSIKAALLSALLFPGIGHFYLKKPIPGTVLAVTAFAALYVLVSNALERAMQISDQILSGTVQPDPAAISQLLAQQPAGTEDTLLGIAPAALLTVWLIGIVGAFRAGRVHSKSDSTNG